MTDRFPFPQKPAYKVLFGLYLFLILYLCRVSQVSYYLLGFYKAQFFSLGITLAALAVFLIYQRRHLLQIVLNYRVLLALLFAAAILIPMCIKRDWQMMYFSILLSILLGVFFSYFVTCAQAGKGFCIVMTVLAVYSLAALPMPTAANFTIIFWLLCRKPWSGTGISAFSGSRGFTSSSCSWHCISASTTWHGKRNSICGAAAAFFAWHC